MATTLINALLPACRHQFSWPRRDDSGENYQVCVRCGAKYSYDWATMRRIAPLAESGDGQETRPGSRRKCGTTRAWVPRERRLRHQVPARFRLAGAAEWLEGTTENISRSGVLLRSAAPLEMGSAVEVEFEMPQELTGEQDARVLCEGLVARVEELPATRKRERSYSVACAIRQYKFAEGE